MNIANQIKPSQVKSWDVVKLDPKSQSRAVKELKNPDWYSFYFKEGLYYPHRKPTISEIVKDEFK